MPDLPKFRNESERRAFHGWARINELFEGMKAMTDCDNTPPLPAAPTHGELLGQIDRLREERDKLQAFKDWTHSYLDAQGVPHHPPGSHGAEGCRIGDRMDWLMGSLRDLREANAALAAACAKAEWALGGEEYDPDRYAAAHKAVRAALAKHKGG